MKKKYIEKYKIHDINIKFETEIWSLSEQKPDLIENNIKCLCTIVHRI